MRRTDHSSRGVLPTVARRVCDLENLVNEETIARVGLQRHMKKKSYNSGSTLLLLLLNLRFPYAFVACCLIKQWEKFTFVCNNCTFCNYICVLVTVNIKVGSERN
jgi:hypothetical protein